MGARHQLAGRYWEGDFATERAIALAERILDVHEILGVDHEDARHLRAVLVLAYVTTGRPDDANAFAARYPDPS
jgi:hypothetical protein